VEAPLDGSDGERQELRDPGDGPLLEVIEQQHDPVVVRQPGKRRPDLPVRLGAIEAAVRRSAELPALREDQAVDLGRLGRFDSAVPRRDPARAVPGDGAEPPRKRGRLLELGQRLEREQEHVLRHVLRRLPAAEGLPRHGEHGRAVAPDQLVKADEVA